MIRSIYLASILFLSLSLPSWSLALCLRQDMAGEWTTASASGTIKKMEIVFKCCDQNGNGQPMCSPPEDLVKVTGLCSSGRCDWGEVVPHYQFRDDVLGQMTRLDTRFIGDSEIRDMVIMRVNADELLVYLSVDVPSPYEDFSMIERMVRQRCFNYFGQRLCLENAARIFDLPATPAPSTQIDPRIAKRLSECFRDIGVDLSRIAPDKAFGRFQKCLNK